MTIRIPETKRYSLTLLLWWLAAAYSLALVLHPFLIGCGCSDVGPDHTCGIVQHYASIGSILWTLLLPAGLWLFRNRENMLILLTILVLIPMLCTMSLLFFPAITGAAELFAADSVIEFVLSVILSIPLVPYVGLLPLLGKTASETTLYTILFLYCLLIAAFAVHLHRKIRGKR